MTYNGAHHNLLMEKEIVERVHNTLVANYGYSESEIATEAWLPGKKKRRPDLVVYESANKVKPLIIIEVKRKISHPSMVEDVLQNYRDTSAKYIVLTDGIDWACFRLVDGEAIEFPDIPKKGEEGSRITRERLKPAKNLAYKFWKIADVMRSEGFKAEDYVKEINKLILCKMMDERESRRTLQFAITPLEAANLASRSVQAGIMNRVSLLFKEVKKRYPDLFGRDEKIELDPLMLGQAISILQSYSISKTDPDIVGALYEKFIATSMKGTVGQYFTPIEIVNFIVQLVDPKPSDSLLDPACGSGGFALRSMTYVWKKISAEKARQEYAQNRLFAMDSNEKMVLTTKMNLLLHNDGHSNVFQASILRDSDMPTEVEEVLARRGFDIIVGRSPMGLVYAAETKRRAESIFIERCLQFLGKEGKMALIVPESVLFSRNLSHLRKSLIKDNFVRAVIGLPAGAFLRYGTSIKTNVLLIEKPGSGKPNVDYNVFMAHLRSTDARDGVPLSEDLSRVLTRYQEFREGKHPRACPKPTTFIIKSSELGSDWTVGRYAPTNVRTVESIDLAFDEAAVHSIPDRSRPRFHLRNLESVADISKGVLVRSKNYLSRPVADAIPYIRIGDMQRRTVLTSNLKYVMKQKIHDLSKGIVRHGDILFSTQGTIGKVARVPKDIPKAVAAPQIAILRARRKVVNPTFLCIALSSSFVSKQLEPLTTGSIIRYLSSRDLRRLKIFIPPMDEQRIIVEKVRDLERKGTRLEAEESSIQRQIEKIIRGEFS